MDGDGMMLSCCLECVAVGIQRTILECFGHCGRRLPRAGDGVHNDFRENRVAEVKRTRHVYLVTAAASSCVDTNNPPAKAF